MKTKNAAPKVKRQDFGFEVKEIMDSGTFIGYGSVFNNIDYGKDIVMPGAFARSLAEREKKGRKTPILWQHRHGEPLGVYQKIEEDKTGLLMHGKLLIGEVQRAREAHALMKAQACDGLSIGYAPVKWETDNKTNVTKLLDVELHETSIVTFPMNDLARVEDVKQFTFDCLKSGKLPTLSEFEEFLCEAGFSRTQAKAVAGHGLRKLVDQCEADDASAKGILDALNGFRL